MVYESLALIPHLTAEECHVAVLAFEHLRVDLERAIGSEGDDEDRGRKIQILWSLNTAFEEARMSAERVDQMRQAEEDAAVEQVDLAKAGVKFINTPDV